MEMKKNSPMPASVIIELIGRIQNYLNRMCRTGIESLKF